MKLYTTPYNGSATKLVCTFLIINFIAILNGYAQTLPYATDRPVGEFLASQNQLLDRMESVIQKTATPTHQLHFRVARMAIQEAQRSFRDSLDVPLEDIASESTVELQKVEKRVKEVWMSQNHYTPQRIAPEYEEFPAYERKITGSTEPNQDIPNLNYRQMRQLKAHTRTNFLVGVAFGSSLMAIATFITGMIR